MADEQVPSDLFVDGSHPSDLFKDGKPASDAPSFMQSHPIIRQGLQRLLTGFSTEDKANAPIDPLTGKQRLAPVDVASQSVLPELQHPADESWPGYLARGAYNQLIRPLGSAAGLLGAASIGEGGNISKSAPIVGKMQPIENAAAAPIAQEIPKPDVPTQPDLPLQDTTQLSPQDKLKAALSAAKPLRKEQEAIYTAERAQRLAKLRGVTTEGEQGFKEQLGALKGDMPKVNFESIRPQLEQPDVDTLFNQISSANNLTDFEKLHAKTGLAKLLGDYGGVVPQDNELYAMGRVFGSDFVQSARNKMSGLTKTGNLVSDIVNVPRSLMASMDMSAPLRQGLGLIHTKEFWNSFHDMNKAFGSEEAFNATMDTIRAKPTYNLGQESGLALTDLEGLLGKEEAFLSKYTQKIPGVKASERAYVAFLDKLRMDTFDRLANQAVAAGKDPSVNRVLAKEIANFVNTATGRGSLGRLEHSAIALNNVFFAPRLISSRLTMLNPMYYVNADPFVRKEALKSLFAIAGFGSTLASLSKAAGAEVETNPTSADFGKIKIGNTRLDPYGGFQQYIVAANKLLSNQTTSTISGKTTQLGSGYGKPTRLDVLQRFGESKLNPALSFVTDMLKGKNYAGQPFDLPSEIGSRVTPMMLQDLYDVAQQDPKLLPITVPASWYGMGVQSYQ